MRPGVRHQELEQLVLGAGQLDEAVAHAHAVPVAVEAELLVGHARRVAVQAAAPQEGAQPRLELAHVERLHEVVVGAGVEAVDAVGHGVARGQHQHRHAVARAAQAPAHLEAVDVRQPDVEHHRVRLAARDLGQRALAVLDRHGVVPAQHERAAQGVAKGAVVVDDQDAHPVHCGCRRGFLLRFLRRSYAAHTHGRESLGMRRQRRTTIIVVGGALAIASVGYGLGTQAGDGTAIADNATTEQDGSGAERGGAPPMPFDRGAPPGLSAAGGQARRRLDRAHARPARLPRPARGRPPRRVRREAREGARHLQRQGEERVRWASCPTARAGSRRSSRRARR